jgi:hypothetical protein
VATRPARRSGTARPELLAELECGKWRWRAGKSPGHHPGDELLRPVAMPYVNVVSHGEHSNRSELVMKIGSIEAGNVGGALAKLWREAGHDVRAGGCDSVAEVAAHGEIVLLAVPASTRPLKPRARSTGRCSSTQQTTWPGNGRRWAPMLPSSCVAKVVKAFSAF